jgi:hypothetical protein
VAIRRSPAIHAERLGFAPCVGAEASVVQLDRQTTGLDGIASAVPEASPRYRNAREEQ